MSERKDRPVSVRTYKKCHGFWRVCEELQKFLSLKFHEMTYNKSGSVLKYEKTNSKQKT